MKKYTHDISNMKKTRGRNFQIGLILSLLFAIFAMNFTTIQKVNKQVHDLVKLDEDEMEIVPRTKQEKKKLPPPPVTEITEIIEDIDDVVFDPEPEPEPDVEPMPDLKPSTEPVPVAQPKKKEKPVVKKRKKPPVVIDKPKIEYNNDPVTMASKMPLFKYNKKLKTEAELRKYSERMLLSYVNKRVKYPAIARENGISGVVVAQFVVEKDGRITDVKIVKGIGGGCDEEVKRLVKKLPKWERSGGQSGRKVRVRYTLPVKFLLN